MNLRKTIAGAAVTLGGAAVMLGLGGTAQAVDLGAQVRPDLDAELGKIANLGDVIRVDASNPAGPIVTGPLLLGDGATGGPLDLGVELGR
ncbi:hypothetical protein IOD16_36885 [Saccharothrix sp. 6-C]|uniref:Uncharacterized protein n=1 Tax=Saccharothrix texasensis TaxID=103734 RepID=A0A3N1H9X6_9PSEU|nr:MULTISPECIES: hypothetical protein [Saccharothrix]QQQ76515.1 hypothetical protein IOD16_36885 [Saccharothrix sp. 6-C]ROP39268.1 hypothetical protein EDD40_4648 [Saccharothrix texasensis]